MGTHQGCVCSYSGVAIFAISDIMFGVERGILEGAVGNRNTMVGVIFIPSWRTWLAITEQS